VQGLVHVYASGVGLFLSEFLLLVTHVTVTGYFHWEFLPCTSNCLDLVLTFSTGLQLCMFLETQSQHQGKKYISKQSLQYICNLMHSSAMLSPGGASLDIYRSLKIYPRYRSLAGMLFEKLRLVAIQ